MKDDENVEFYSFEEHDEELPENDITFGSFIYMSGNRMYGTVTADWSWDRRDTFNDHFGYALPNDWDIIEGTESCRTYYWNPNQNRYDYVSKCGGLPVEANMYGAAWKTHNDAVGERRTRLYFDANAMTTNPQRSVVVRYAHDDTSWGTASVGVNIGLLLSVSYSANSGSIKTAGTRFNF
ncbi:hypothetical protein [Halalkalibacterium ligniniphilum]|uniref:hypothetical protein n=1 Tax=Halalkalibacterium ligniniphilum TaxID=1134413 RepID=UPI000349005E|nr:hypothetical protein [Halalkalibacterium ligniniphilum]